MILLDVTCRSRIHDTDHARRYYGCCCPLGFAVAYRPPRRRHAYVAGRIQNREGPRRRAVAEGDWVAVERAVGGDRSLRLAVVERDEAIDRLDRLGLSANEVARRLGVTARTVTRRRAQRRLLGGKR